MTTVDRQRPEALRAQSGMFKYVIINDYDAPRPSLVAQYVEERGYCYMDRTKSGHDGMSISDVTPVEYFGWTIEESHDGIACFFRNEPFVSVAKYKDGSLRQWQSSFEYFERPILCVSAKGLVVKCRRHNIRGAGKGNRAARDQANS